MKRLLQHPATQTVLVWLVGGYLAFALRTTRWVLDGAEHLAPIVKGQVVVAAFWHERLALMPMLWLTLRRMDPKQRGHVLVSRHRDGRFIGAVLRRFNVGLVYGSSRRGGPSSLRTALDLLAKGEHLVMTPDGPRGPRRVAAPGVAQIAAASGLMVLPCSAQISHRHVLPSWDRMVLPLPFGRGVLVCLPPIVVAREGWEAALPEIATALTQAADRADQLCAA